MPRQYRTPRYTYLLPRLPSVASTIFITLPYLIQNLKHSPPGKADVSTPTSHAHLNPILTECGT
jgi:hypothetical protein